MHAPGGVVSGSRLCLALGLHLRPEVSAVQLWVRQHQLVSKQQPHLRWLELLPCWGRPAASQSRPLALDYQALQATRTTILALSRFESLFVNTIVSNSHWT